MRLHLVGGFLGSGKTTAIIHASQLLLQRGLRVGVVTNDQGKYLVDTAFVRLTNIPAVEVTGGCFCCNYADLDGSLEQLMAASQPDVIFAESVGSCADLVATVVKPLLQLRQSLGAPASFSVFTDCRLLRRRLRGDPMPFSEDVVYIFDKQLEEAGLIVVNKVDLVSADALAEVKCMAASAYPDKVVLTQSSLADSGVIPWLDLLGNGDGLLPAQSLDIDYVRYGRGEAQLAWLDEEVRLAPGNPAGSVRRIIESTLAALRTRQVGIGHLKFLIKAGGFERKISFLGPEDAGWKEQIPVELAGEISLLVNARVEMPAEELRGLFLNALQNAGVDFKENGVSYFHPAQPKPTYRYR